MSVANSLRTAIIVLSLILFVYVLSMYDVGTLLPHSTPRTPLSYGRQVSTIHTPSESYFENCRDDFYVPESLDLESPCFVPSPEGYKKPYLKPLCLWETPLANIGKNNNGSNLVELHLEHQNWAMFKDDNVVIRVDGGTSVRNFGTNFDYVQELLKWIDLSSVTVAHPNSSKLILDTGAGIASVSAAFEDERGAAGSGFKVFSYVLPDDYLRLGSIIADRRLVSMLQSFSGEPLPFPDNSFHVVHCRWCWHHVQGFDVWLNEMNRLLIAGGYFIFTFTPLRDVKLLPPEEWQRALDKQPWTCELHAKIIRVCRKANPENSVVQVAHIDRTSDWAEEFTRTVMESFSIISSTLSTNIDSLRILNVGCVRGNECLQLENVLNSRNALSTFSREYADSLRMGLTSGSMGFFHNWTKPAPFYPRSFDVIHLVCEESKRLSWTVALKSLELHRLLAPGGMIVLMKSTCAQFNSIDIDWSMYGFRVSNQSESFMICEKERAGIAASA